MATIGIDARKYFDFGIGTYIRNLTQGLAKLQSDHSFVLIAAEQERRKIETPDRWTVISSPHRKYSVSEFLRLGYDAKRSGIDLFHSPHYTLPLGLKGRSIVTIHDLIHLRFPEIFNMMQRIYARGMIGHALRNSAAVITVSEITKRDILSSFRVREEKLKVIHLGVGMEFRQMKEAADVRDFRRQNGLEGPAILYVGNVKPHKNIEALLRAFNNLTSVRHDVSLVFVGGRPSLQPTLWKSLKPGSNVKELGQLSQEDLVRAYNAAEVLVLPSRYEGFGLPALEAMACGTPVIVSNGGSLPEIVGDAAIIFPLEKEASLEDALKSILSDSSLRDSLMRKGIERAKKFSWHEAARNTLAVYDSVL